MKLKLAKKTSSASDSLAFDYCCEKPILGRVSTYDFASLWKLFDSNSDNFTVADAWRITKGGFPLKTSMKDVI